MIAYKTILIKSLDDAKEFIKGFSGNGSLYVMGDKEDICIERFKGEFSISTRPATARGNVFFPYFELDDATKGVYKYRKYINKQLMSYD